MLEKPMGRKPSALASTCLEFIDIYLSYKLIYLCLCRLQHRHVIYLVSSPPVPSELDDEVDDAYLPVGYIWAHPCKLPSCLGYGKSWKLRSNFLLHLQEREAYRTSATTPAARRAIDIDWRYTTGPYRVEFGRV